MNSSANSTACFVPATLCRRCSLLVYRTNPPLPDWKEAPSSTTSKSKLPSGGSVAQKGALEPDFFLGQGQGGSLSRWEMIRLNSAFWVCLKVIFGHRERLGALGLSVELWWLSCPAGNLLYCSNNATVDRTLKNHPEAVLANPLWRFCWPWRVIASRMPCQCSLHYAPVTSSGHSLISGRSMFTIQEGSTRSQWCLTYLILLQGCDVTESLWIP